MRYALHMPTVAKPSPAAANMLATSFSFRCGNRNQLGLIRCPGIGTRMAIRPLKSPVWSWRTQQRHIFGAAASSLSPHEIVHLQSSQSSNSKTIKSVVLNSTIAGAMVALAAFFPPPPPAHAAGAPSPSSYTGLDIASSTTKGSQPSVEVLGDSRWVSPEELDEDAKAALNRFTNERTRKKIKRMGQLSKGGKLVKDPLKSIVPNPDDVPSNEEIQKMSLQSAWRVDKLKDLTYTQFWRLITEKQIEKVTYALDRRSVHVALKPTAPGGARTEKVALPYDPELFDHMVSHGVYIETPQVSPAWSIVHALARLVFPVWFSFLLIKFAFRLGRKKKRDKIFGGARLERLTAKDAIITFKDIAGIDQVKSEITEVVTFLTDAERFLKLGAKSPAGVLLVGPPGTGKTLLAKAIAGEAGVPFFSIAGTEFMEMFVGVGASRVRDMFQQARAAAPCILFIDEFDGLGRAREYGGAGNDESVHTINQLLTEMDGFEDNTGVVVMAATNRPGALDQALTRPGRFDRIVHLPLPNLEGRIGILKVHSVKKKVDPNLDYEKIARATAGSTGAELMNLMNQSAIIAAQQGQPYIVEEQVFEALEKILKERTGIDNSSQGYYEGPAVPAHVRRTIAVYEAGRVMLAHMSPDFDDIQRVSICPNNVATSFTYFLPKEEQLESRVVTRSYMESRLVVLLAGRCAERLVYGDANIAPVGSEDLIQVNAIAREMVLRCGFGRRTGPVALMDKEEVYLNDGRSVSDISTEMAMIALTDVSELIEGAEAKVYWALANNWNGLAALVDAFEKNETMTGREVAEVLEGAGVKKFDTNFVDGFGWSADGAVVWPGSTKEIAGIDVSGGNGASAPGTESSNANGAKAPAWWSPRNPYTVRSDIANLLSESEG